MLLLLSGPLYLIRKSSLEYGYSMHPTSTWMLHTKQQIHHLKYLKCPISYYNNSSATFHLELLISGDINPNPGPETLNNTPTNATQLHEISYSRDELLNLRNAPFTDVTALCYSALSQIVLEYLPIDPKHTAPHIEVRKLVGAEWKNLHN